MKIDQSLLVRLCHACGRRFQSNISICPKDDCALTGDDPGVAELGSYRLLECIGEGAMGAVYCAVQRKLSRTVAIKMLRRQLTSEPDMISRFFHEARAANIISNPHVVEIYDFVEAGPEVYFVMELLRGRDLYQAVHLDDRSCLTIDRAVAILEQTAVGLEATHERGIVHRDLKPENIFLVEKNGVHDFVKIFDFGVAQLNREDGRRTVAGAVLGTPEYMSPEQARGHAVDQRADIYSLGCVAYEMLSRHQVFCGLTPADVLSMQVEKPPPPLRQWVPAVPPLLEEAVMRALSKAPADRPPTARDFARSLTRAIGREPADESTLSGTRRSASRPSPGLVLRASEAGRPAWKSIATVIMAVTLLIEVILLGHRGQHPGVVIHPAAAPPMVGSRAPSEAVDRRPAERRAGTTASGISTSTPTSGRAEAPRRRGRPAPTAGRGILISPADTIDPFAQ